MARRVSAVFLEIQNYVVEIYNLTPMCSSCWVDFGRGCGYAAHHSVQSTITLTFAAEHGVTEAAFHVEPHEVNTRGRADVEKVESSAASSWSGPEMNCCGWLTLWRRGVLHML